MNMYKVCFADDEPIIFKVLNALVDWADVGCQIVGTATDGVEALSLYEKEKPDFIIIDIKMPLMDGLSCVKYIREKDKRVKIVLLTASDSFESAQEALNLGANGYLLKPVSRKSINKIVSKITAELNQETSRAEESSSGSEELLLQKELQRLYGASMNAEENTAWLNHSRLIQGKYGLIDISFRWNIQEKPGDTEVLSEIFSEYIRRAGIKIYARFISANNRIIYAVSPMKENTLDFLRNYHKDIPPDLKYSIYLLQEASGNISPQALCSSLKANKIHSFYHSENHMEIFLKGIKEEDSPLPINEIKNIVSGALQELSITKVSDFLRDIFSCAQEELRSPGQLQGFCYNMIMQLKIHMKDLGLLQSAEELDKIGIERFLSIECAEELLKYTLSCIIKYLEDLEKREEFAGNKSIVLKANAYAMENYRDPKLSLESAADYVGLSKNYFIRLYGKETGISFWTYITGLRIERAKLLLRSTQLSMMDICAQIGYDDVSYFSRKFKLEVGISPRKYRDGKENI